MKKLEILKGAIIATVAVVATAGSAAAMPITVPTSLNPGDQYRLAFVTSSKRDALSSVIGDYNTFVTGVANSQAALSALNTTWTAIASTAAVNARVNTNTDPIATGVPIFLLDDTQLASSYPDLWDGSIALPLNIDESGTALFPVQATADLVWTGTNFFGFGAPGFTLGSPSGIAIAGCKLLECTTGHRWIRESGISVDVDLRFYALSGGLVVPTLADAPEPGTILLFGVGLAGLSYMRRGRVA